MRASVRLDSKISNRVSFETLARPNANGARDKTAPEAISCIHPPARTRADDGSLNGGFEILKFSTGWQDSAVKAWLNFKYFVSITAIKWIKYFSKMGKFYEGL